MESPRPTASWRPPALVGAALLAAAGMLALPAPEPRVAQHAAAEDAPPPPGPIRTPVAEFRESVATTLRLEVRVLSAAGEPLEGARVLFHRVERIGFPEDRLGLTGRDGSFASEELAAGLYRVRVERHGFESGTARELGLPAPEGAALSFALAPSRPAPDDGE